MSRSPVLPLVDEGLGNSAYLVELGDGRARAVAPSRDVRALRRVAERRGLSLGYAAQVLAAAASTGEPLHPPNHPR